MERVIIFENNSLSLTKKVLDTRITKTPSGSTPRVHLTVPAQPTITSCGPTCLHAVYQHYGLDISIGQLIREVPAVETGGTLGVSLGIDALRRGFEADLYTCNLRVFDPTWFHPERQDLEFCLSQELPAYRSGKRRSTIQAYLEFARQGGEIYYEDLSRSFLRKLLKKSAPVLTGLSATALYREAREIAETNTPDPIKGEPVGHFVVLSGYNTEEKTVAVGDPFDLNPFSVDRHYEVAIDRLIHAILLGVLTYDGNLLVIRPAKGSC